uniref:Uncharacterized protein n=1 Tax=viral metagenome TaxID=1070528 RepID=A0A6M3XRI9_9ZZZZ
MIRFIDLGKQYWLDSDNKEFFAYIDTVPDRFVDVNGNQYWDCWEDFEQDYIDASGWRGEVDLERFKGLTDKKFFRPHEF